jgi:hypothetical protein
MLMPESYDLKAPSRIYVIGDIHGRLDLLDQVIEKIELDNVPMNPIQLRMARAAVGWGVRELAEKAGITASRPLQPI